MPTLDRRPRRRLHSATAPDFASAREVHAACSAARALHGAERDEAQRDLRPRIARWIMANWASPPKYDDAQLARITLMYLDGSRFLPVPRAGVTA